MNKKCTITIDDEVWCRVHGLDPSDNKSLFDKFSFFVDGYVFMPAYKLGGWSGKTEFFKKTGKTYTKLLSEIIPYLAGWNYEINLVDNRIPVAVITDRIDENHFSYCNIKLRPYQVEAVNAMLDEGSGLVIAGTGSGKCLFGTTLINIDISNELKDIIDEINSEET